LNAAQWAIYLSNLLTLGIEEVDKNVNPRVDRKLGKLTQVIVDFSGEGDK
jgi:hypothetical protein